ncbi:hypothetical protein GCM10009765_84430 [Fodinicola feengrottensis]|uniref:SCP2 domain-containing protein n=1 Tax=Fodinicola feengrottensis TaxID=435914 RepID=A0ABN2JDQ3_9ACTN
MAVRIFSPEWAEQVRQAVDRGPSAQLRASKLETYWDWIDEARGKCSDSWALGVRDLDGKPAYLLLQWDAGVCKSAEISSTAPDATYVLAGGLDVWQALLAGEDTGRIVMYRRLLLEKGDVVRFFRSIYFFVESVAAIGRVPADAAGSGR